MIKNDLFDNFTRAGFRHNHREPKEEEVFLSFNKKIEPPREQWRGSYDLDAWVDQNLGNLYGEY